MSGAGGGGQAVAMERPTSLSTFSRAGVVRGRGEGGTVRALVRGSVAVGLVGVLWRLLGGRGVSHAALGQ